MQPTTLESAPVTPGYASGYRNPPRKSLVQNDERKAVTAVTVVTTFHIPCMGAPVTPPAVYAPMGMCHPNGYTVTHPLIYLCKPLININKEGVTVAVTGRNPGYTEFAAGYGASAACPHPTTRLAPPRPSAAGSGRQRAGGQCGRGIAGAMPKLSPYKSAGGGR